jgi:fructose-bisphosphate aldolase class II
MTGAIRTVLGERPGEFDPRAYLGAARTAMQAVVAERMTQFGQAGHAGDYEPRSLDEMRAFYAAEAARA